MNERKVYSINYGLLKDFELSHIMNTIKPSNDYSIIKSYLGAIKASFLNRISIERRGKNIAFLFSSCYQTRKDHLQRFRKVVNLFPDGLVITPVQRLKISNVLYLPAFVQFLKSFQKSMSCKQGAYYAFCLYLTYIEAKCFIKYIEKSSIKKVVVFCDMHPVDNMVVQMCKKQGIKTYTLQHGHYSKNSPAFVHSVSDVFLGFGSYTYNIAEKSGFDVSKFRSVGMMDLIGEEVPSKIVLSSNNSCLVILSGIVEEDISLLTLSEIVLVNGYKRVIKLHPGSDENSYAYDWNDEDSIITNQRTIPQLFNQCDYQIVAGGSTVFAEGVIKLFPSFIYDYKCKRYDGVQCLRFRNSEELMKHIYTLNSNPRVIEESMIITRKVITEVEDINEKYIDAISRDGGF